MSLDAFAHRRRDKKRRAAENLTGIGRKMAESLEIARPGDSKMAS
jgi:hypothetical protein